MSCGVYPEAKRGNPTRYKSLAERFVCFSRSQGHPPFLVSASTLRTCQAQELYLFKGTSPAVEVKSS